MSYLARAGVLASLAFAAFLLFPSALSPISGGLAEDEPNTLTIGFSSSLDSLNPFIGVSDAAELFHSLVYDGLTGIGNNMESVPNLAVSWWVVPESLLGIGETYGSVWQYNLTEDAVWHDGESFTAEDVVFTVNLIANNYSDLWAPQPYSYFVARAEAVSQYSVMIHFADRSDGSPMPVSFGGSLHFPILPKHMLEHMPSSDLGFKWIGVFQNWSNPIVGTGPFMAQDGIYASWLNGDPVVLMRNPYYHAEAEYEKRIHFDRLELRFRDDEAGLIGDLKDGIVDVACLSPGGYLSVRSDVQDGLLADVQTFSDLACSQRYAYISWSAGAYTWWGGYSTNPSTRDPVIRRAMAMATDKETIVREIFHGLAEEGSTMISPVSAWHYEPSSSVMYAFDPDAARYLLESNGYTDVDSDGVREATATSPSVLMEYVEEGRELRYELIFSPDDPFLEETAEYLRAEWEGVGVNLTLRPSAYWPLHDALCPYGGDLGLLYAEVDPDPNAVLFTQSSRAIAGWSDTSYLSAQYDDAYNSTVTDMEADERMADVLHCQMIHYLDQPYMVLAYVNENYAWSTKDFKGWGNWSENPGRSLEGVWGANPLFYDLMPKGSQITAAEVALVGGIATAAVIAGVAAVVLLRRRRKPMP